MGREVRRVPMDWQHPMHWTPRWDRNTGTSPMTLVPLGLMDDYPGAVATWEEEGQQLARREGFDWTFHLKYNLTGYQGRDDTKPVAHPFVVDEDADEDGVTVRDADHLHELMTVKHQTYRPDPAEYMPVFPEGTATGWVMYETTSEGTPISPVFETPEELAHWLADNGASTFGYNTGTYDQWLGMIRAGWAPSAVSDGGGLRSGVEFIADGAR